MGRLKPGQVAPGIEKKSAAIANSIDKRIALLAEIKRGAAIPEGMPTSSIASFLHWDNSKLEITRIGSINSVKSYSRDAYNTLRDGLRALGSQHGDTAGGASRTGETTLAAALRNLAESKATVRTLANELLTLRQGFNEVLDYAASIAARNEAHASAIRRYRERYGLQIVPKT